MLLCRKPFSRLTSRNAVHGAPETAMGKRRTFCNDANFYLLPVRAESLSARRNPVPTSTCLCKPSHKFLKKRRLNRDESSRCVTFAEFLQLRVSFQFAVAEIEHRQSMFVATQRRAAEMRQRAVRLIQQRTVERLGGEGMISKVRRRRSTERRFVFRWQRNAKFQIAKTFLLFTVIAQFHLGMDV